MDSKDLLNQLRFSFCRTSDPCCRDTRFGGLSFGAKRTLNPTGITQSTGKFTGKERHFILHPNGQTVATENQNHSLALCCCIARRPRLRHYLLIVRLLRAYAYGTE